MISDCRNLNALTAASHSPKQRSVRNASVRISAAKEWRASGRSACPMDNHPRRDVMRLKTVVAQQAAKPLRATCTPRAFIFPLIFSVVVIVGRVHRSSTEKFGRRFSGVRRARRELRLVSPLPSRLPSGHCHYESEGARSIRDHRRPDLSL